MPTTVNPDGQATGPAVPGGASAAKRVGGDHHLSLPATWVAYLRLLKARGGRAKPRYTYIHGRLTIVSTGPAHEAIKKRVGGLIELMFQGLKIRFQPYGSVTLLKAHRPRAGIEGDECYYLNNIALVRGKDRFVMGDLPAPDLVVEVVVSHPERDALAAYRSLGAREVWVCRRGGVRFLVLGADGRYAPSPTSACLPALTSEEFSRWAFRDDLPDEFTVRHLFQDWIKTTLIPRARAAEQGDQP